MSQSIEALRNSFKIPELKQRILFTLGMLVVYRLGAHVPTPGVNGQALAAIIGNQSGILVTVTRKIATPRQSGACASALACPTGTRTSSATVLGRECGSSTGSKWPGCF